MSCDSSTVEEDSCVVNPRGAAETRWQTGVWRGGAAVAVAWRSGNAAWSDGDAPPADRFAVTVNGG